MLLSKLFQELGQDMNYGIGHPDIEVKIEFNAVVDDLVVKDIYTVPGHKDSECDDEHEPYPPAVHIVVEPNQATGVDFARIPPD